MRAWLLALLLVAAPLQAAIDAYPFDDPAKRARYRALIEELRCPKCQNQNIADSNAPLASDLRQKVYDMIQAGRDDATIEAYMVQRYGDFITYRPPVRPLTWPLWFGPLLGLAVIGIALALWIRRRNREQPAPLSDAERERLQTLLEQSDGNRS